MRHYQQACVGGFIQKEDGSFLVVKRSEDDDFLPSLWELPGGGMDFGEEIKSAVVREIQEETGLKISVGKPVSVATHFMEKEDEKVQRIEITFLCKLLGDDQVVLSFEHSDYKWIQPSEINSVHLTEYMKGIIMDSLENI